MADRFPDYDVLAKRDTASWNAKTRDVVDQRLATEERTGVLSDRQLLTLPALCDRIVPQPEGRPPVNTVALIVEKIATRAGDGFRHHQLPFVDEAWRRGLDAIEAEAQARHARAFAALAGKEADALLAAIECGDARGEAWGDMPPQIFWQWRMLPDIVGAYWSHPSAWSAMGFGGPAGPRGYVRLGTDRRDPWEAAQAGDGALLSARFRNCHVG